MSYLTNSFDEKIIGLLNGGRVGLLPTDTIYGLSGRAADKPAVERIYRLKNRGSRKPLIILISDLKMLDLLSISAEQAEAVDPYWPGALSVIFRTDQAPDWLQRGTGSLAVRLPNFPELLALIDRVGPLVSTSANIRGQRPVPSIQEARKIFGDRIDFYVDGGLLNGKPSTLAALDGDRLNVIRPGAVKIIKKETS